MKNIFRGIIAVLLVAAGLFVSNGVAQAERVQIYDGNVNDILNDIREKNDFIKNHSDELRKRIKNYNEFENLDLTIRGTHYFTGTDGFRYCESYFGDSDKNRLIFQVNNDGSVSSAWIISPVHTLAGEKNEKGAAISGMLLGSIFNVIGLSDSESDNIMDNYKHSLENFNTKIAEQKFDEARSIFNKTFSVWCTKSKRYINLNVSADESTEPWLCRYFITAHT